MNYNNKISYQVVKTTFELKEFATFLCSKKKVAVDLEADSMYHFKEKVCLLQISANGVNTIVDPLAVKDLSPLNPMFEDINIKKVFHGADYDIRSLHRDFGIEVNNLFDTQLASMFLGIKETGLDAVLKKRFNVKTDKRYQKKDWSQRPLCEEMLEYAARDVDSLLQLAEILEKELEKNNRLSWVTEECNNLSKVRHKTDNTSPLYLKFKGAGHLEPRSLAVLEMLLEFRIEIAQKKDRPLYKIFNNKSLMQIALQKPVSLDQLKKKRILGEKQVAIYGSDLIEIVKKGIKKPEDHLPVYPRMAIKNRDSLNHGKVKVLKSWRSERAVQLGIDPGILLNNTILNKIVLLDPKNRKDLVQIQEMKEWQNKNFGDEVVSIMKQL